MGEVMRRDFCFVGHARLANDELPSIKMTMASAACVALSMGTKWFAKVKWLASVESYRQRDKRFSRVWSRADGASMVGAKVMVWQ